MKNWKYREIEPRLVLFVLGMLIQTGVSKPNTPHQVKM
jgi:hypothetical protein